MVEGEDADLVARLARELADVVAALKLGKLPDRIDLFARCCVTPKRPK